MRTGSCKEKAQRKSNLCEQSAKSHDRPCVVHIATLWRWAEFLNNVHVRKDFPKEVD